VTLLVAASTATIGSFLIGDDDDSSGSDLADAFMVFERAIDYGDDGYAELSECPVGDPEVLVSVVADVVDVDPEIFSGEVFIDAYAGITGYPAITQCFISSEPDDGFGPTSVGFSVSAVPVGSYRDFLADDAYDVDIEVTIEKQQRWSEGGPSGDLFAYCYRADDLSGCGADLVDRFNGVVLSVYLQGPDRTGDEVVRALESVVRRMASNLPDFVEENPVPMTVAPGELDS
jgi:hypothetical protein